VRIEIEIEIKVEEEKSGKLIGIFESI